MVNRSKAAGVDGDLNVEWWAKKSTFERSTYIHRLIHMMHNSMPLDDDPVLRVQLNADGTYQTLRMFVASPKNIRYYDTRDELPQWVQDRMLMLDMMRDANIKDRKIEGIGMMVTDTVYWLNPMDEEDNNGYDT
jgi:hypothetical protein